MWSDDSRMETRSVCACGSRWGPGWLRVLSIMAISSSRSRASIDAGRAARGSGLEDDPAGDAAGGFRAVCRGCVRERVYRADLGAEVPLVDQAGEFGQLSAAGLLDEDDLPDVVPAGGWLRGGLDRDQRSSGPQEGGGAGEHLAADRVQYQVGLAGSGLEAGARPRGEAGRAPPGGPPPGPRQPRPHAPWPGMIEVR